MTDAVFGSGDRRWLGYSAAKLRELERQAADRQPLTACCAHCDWTYTGPAGDAREHARKHRLDQHPQARQRKHHVPGSVSRYRKDGER